MVESKKVVIVTGAAGGLGRCVAHRFLEQGHCVMLVDRSEKDLQELVSLWRRHYEDHMCITVADVTDEEQVQQYVKRTLETFGHIDILINNAGIEATNAKLVNQTLENYERVMSVNATSTFLGMKYVLPTMMKQNTGSIVNLASTVGYRGSAGISPYSAAKHAVIGLTKSAALEYAEHGIRINAVCPGFIQTALTERLAKDGVDNEQDAEKRLHAFTDPIPLKRFATPDEVTNLIFFLSSDMASYITGATYEIDGGRTAR